MYKKISRSIFILFFMISLLIPCQSALAAQWHQPDGRAWSISKVCRDGAVLVGTHQFGIMHGLDVDIADFPWTIYAELILDEVADGEPDDTLTIEVLDGLDEPINLFEGAPDDTVAIDALGSETVWVTKNDFPTLITGLVTNPGTQVTYMFGAENMYWTSVEEGSIIRFTRKNFEGVYLPSYFLATVEDCYLAADAPIKSPELQFKATVSTRPNVCTSDTGIAIDADVPVYTCLIIENGGDVTFDEHRITDTAFGNDISFPLTALPSAQFSITHAVAQAAELNIDLGPFQAKEDLKSEFTWQTTGGSHMIQASATIKIKREFKPRYISASSGGTVDGITFADEDILIFNPATEAWSMYFDGSDVGIAGSKDVNAFHILDDGDILFSLNAPHTLQGIPFDDSDIIRFSATSLGNNTDGTFTLYFDGSDVGLSTSSEDIDAITLLSNGDLVISTLGAPNVAGVTSVRDEDLLHFHKTQLGSATQGTWSLYMDGTDLQLTNQYEDVWATWIDPHSGHVHLSTHREYSAASWDTSLNGDGDDIFICTPVTLGGWTQCALSLFWDGEDHDFGDERIDGYSRGPTFVNIVTVDDIAVLGETEVEDEAIDDELDDDVIEFTYLYLPLISR